MLLVGGLLAIVACETSNRAHPKSPDYLQGEALAKQHCSGCHLYTEPELLDRVVWPNVLSVMRKEMEKQGYEIDRKDWIAVQQFYMNFAPKAFHSSIVNDLPKPQTQFKVQTLFADSVSLNQSTMLINRTVDSTIHVGQSNGAIHTFSNLQSDTTSFMANIPIDQVHSGDKIFTLAIGNLGPMGGSKGQLFEQLNTHYNPLVNDLFRPVDLSVTDLNNDEKEDFVVSSFGADIGKLSIYTVSDTGMMEVIVESLPGATQHIMTDIDNDGLQDIVALFAQGRETIIYYHNEGEFTFSATPLLNFPPVYGINSFELVDINHDDHLDLIVTAGDNDDYSQVFKPYHGVRIFLNDGSCSFTESYFYSINGASKVKSADFNADGKLDFVVLAMYPDHFSRPWETLLYFEQEKTNKFQIQYFEASPSANWILMDVADIDFDGDQDIITAANRSIHGVLPPALQKQWNRQQTGINVYLNNKNQ